MTAPAQILSTEERAQQLIDAAHTTSALTSTIGDHPENKRPHRCAPSLRVARKLRHR